MIRISTIALLTGQLILLAACASGPDMAELGEGKQEFEQYSQGGNYRFQYVAEGSDGYRTVLWRQGESLSDDGKDASLVAGVVKSVFLERFCKDLQLPVSLSDGSPSPLGSEGKWQASLRCATPPPKPKPEKKPEKPKAKPKPAPEAETAAKPESEPKPTAEASAEAPAPKPKPRRASADGPVECVANSEGGFDCRPKR
jgi:hypothetical protein